MSEKIIVPTLGESVTEATVSKWLKSVGEVVDSDEPLVELETDKVNVEVPSPLSGVLEKINVKEGKFLRNKIILRNLNLYGNKFSVDEILNAILLLRNCDLTVKTTSINERHLFHSIVAEICEGMSG